MPAPLPPDPAPPSPAPSTVPTAAVPPPAAPPVAPPMLPRAVWMLGLVSLFMDVSSEMILALLPVFLVSGLGASALVLGLIEGMADATSQVVKVFSGTLSDWLGKRKALAVFGYGLSALSKPLFPLAGSVGMVVGARFMDRVGKGIRGAPRDALMADMVAPGQRGAAFGLRQSLDTVGAILGPLVAAGLMALTGDIRLVFAAAVLPALLSVGLLAVGVREPAVERPADGGFPLTRAGLARLGRPFWLAVGAAGFLLLGRFGEAFLLLRAEDVGVAAASVPLVYACMNVAFALSAYPAGRLSDRLGRETLLMAGFVLLAVAHAVLALASGTLSVVAGTVLWGLHLGLTQGILAALVADAAPADRRGTAFGVFNLVTGLSLLLASLGAGVLWTAAGPATTFATAGGVTCGAILLTLLTRRARTLR
ncbi:major facilitator superfamily transport protein [Rhodospirillum centenum SW]|uniref:Major facilitator superfamily transport protein n=2 Tax=Rhodospirillum centenum TaxID=34018 RepID=B6IXF1_RHOCS|nr:major facilitator superfamily transport protein [Rhodospirillum centenum SW]